MRRKLPPIMGASRRKFARIFAIHAAMAGAALLSAASPATAQTLTSNATVQANFQSITQIGSGIGAVAQMTFGPDGRLYVATFGSGVKRYDYNPSGSLTNGVTVWSRTGTSTQINGSLGIAFHQDPTLGTVMYLAPAISSNFNVAVNITQSILRLTNNDNDNTWGGAGDVNQNIVNNLRLTDLHQVNQMLVSGNTLYAGIGSRTRTGGAISEYGGVANTDDGEFAYSGAINWIQDLTTLSSDTTTANIAGFTITQPWTDTQPFTSTDPSKLRVYSTGYRNPYGIALNSEGELWATMNQNEAPFQKPDELHRITYQDDHGFPKKNEVSGDWKLNSTAISAGYFQSAKTPVALLGDNASADGIEFTYRNQAFAGKAFVVRYAVGDDLLAIDPTSGAITQVATGFSNPLEVFSDPLGNLLVGTAGGQIYRLVLKNDAVPEPSALPLLFCLAMAQLAFNRHRFDS